jgi:hypothetical protein
MSAASAVGSAVSIGRADVTDERPKPEYGEYATPEQQAAAMGRTYVPPTDEPKVAPAMAIEPFPTPSAGYINRFFTVFLLGFGALNLLGDVPAYFNLVSVLNGAYSSAGLSIVVPSGVNHAGIPILIANILIYAATVVWAVITLRRGRVSFYIPILGFLLFVAVAYILILIFAPSLSSVGR